MIFPIAVVFIILAGLSYYDAYSLTLKSRLTRTHRLFLSDSDRVWKVDEDSSELVCESSTELKISDITSSSVYDKASATPSISSYQTSTAMTANGGSAFDVGLLIAFPVIIGTLALFFLFPLLAPKLAETLPPVPN
jgi:hypothetical protein